MSDFLFKLDENTIVSWFFWLGFIVRFIEDTKRETKWGSRKLEDLGFEYKFDADKIIYDSIACAKRLGAI